MEFKQYLDIFKKHSKLFLLTVVVFILAGVLFQLFRPLGYNAQLTLNITRIGSQQTSDYRYDDFYRLQADEKFADTVVRWLASPKVAEKILNDSGVATSGLSHWTLVRMFKAERFSSQVVSLSYSAKTQATAQNLAGSVLKIINQEAEELNKIQKEESWFTVISDEPIIRENKWPWEVVILLSFLVGMLAGLWTVLIKHYLE